MKIVRTDNFDRGTVDDVLVAQRVSEHYGKIIVELLNDMYSGSDSPDYFMLVSDDYKLFEVSW